MPSELTEGDRRRIEGAVSRFVKNKRSFELVAESLMDCLARDADLKEFIHFIKRRVKDPDSLRKKLERRALGTGQLSERLAERNMPGPVEGAGAVDVGMRETRGLDLQDAP